jgi:hypothetical protein
VSRWISDTDETEWAALFTGYTRSAYRLEGQQVYSSDQEDAVLARFLAGEPLNIDLSWTAPKTRAQVAAGRTKTRVRVVVEPPTDYTRLELVVYPQLAAAGEDIRIIAVPEGEWPAGLPRHDYWLFDDHDVWRMHYGDDHRFLGAELLDDESLIAEHLEWRDIALAQAVPLNDYLSSRQVDK